MLRRILTVWAVVLLGASVTSTALAQDDEVAGEARGDYAWGEGGGSTGGATAEDPMRIMAYAGAGIGARLVRNVDAEFDHEFVTPAFVDLGGALYLPGGDFRHGPALFVSTNLTGEYNSGVGAGRQWSFTPGYQVLLPFRRWIDGMEHDYLQFQGRIGVPITLSDVGGSVYVSPGLELAAAIQFKFLAGLGVYFEVQADLYGGFKDTLHPTISGDLGLLFDYEVLP